MTKDQLLALTQSTIDSLASEGRGRVEGATILYRKIIEAIDNESREQAAEQSSGQSDQPAAEAEAEAAADTSGSVAE